MCGIGEGGAESLLGFADEGLGGWEALGGGGKQGLQAGRQDNEQSPSGVRKLEPPETARKKNHLTQLNLGVFFPLIHAYSLDTFVCQHILHFLHNVEIEGISLVNISYSWCLHQDCALSKHQLGF